MPPADFPRMPNCTDVRAVPLPEAHYFRELYSFVTKVCEHLGTMTGDWWQKYHFKASPPTPGITVVIDPEGEAAWHRRRAAKEYRDQLRNQLLRLWQPGLPIPPEQEANPEADIRNKLTPWIMGSLNADSAVPMATSAGALAQANGNARSATPPNGKAEHLGENISERLPQTDAEANLLTPVVADLLRQIPENWTEFDSDTLSAVQSRALFLLVAAGIVEAPQPASTSDAQSPDDVRGDIYGDGRTWSRRCSKAAGRRFVGRVARRLSSMEKRGSGRRGTRALCGRRAARVAINHRRGASPRRSGRHES